MERRRVEIARSDLIRFHPDLDLEAVRDDLQLITARGYHRGRDLATMLEEVLAGSRG